MPLLDGTVQLPQRRLVAGLGPAHDHIVVHAAPVRPPAPWRAGLVQRAGNHLSGVGIHDPPSELDELEVIRRQLAAGYIHSHLPHAADSLHGLMRVSSSASASSATSVS